MDVSRRVVLLGTIPISVSFGPIGGLAGTCNSPGPTPPPTPTPLGPIDAVIADTTVNDQMAVSWDAPSGASGSTVYTVFTGTSETGPFTFQASTTGVTQVTFGVPG